MHSPCRPVVADSRPSQSSAHRVRIAESERSIPAQHDRVKWFFPIRLKVGMRPD